MSHARSRQSTYTKVNFSDLQNCFHIGKMFLYIIIDLKGSGKTLERLQMRNMKTGYD